MATYQGVQVRVPSFGIGVGMSRIRVAGSNIVASLVDRVGTSNLPRATVMVRLARDVLLRGGRGTRGFLGRLGRTNLRLTLSSFKANCSGFRCLDRLRPSVIGVSHNFASGTVASGGRCCLLGRFDGVVRGLNLGLYVRNVRARSRLRGVGLLGPSCYRKFC